MADIRINALPTTATDFASDDYIAIDGTTNGTRKLNAKTANLTFSDITLGTSGPSVKSTLSARAPRQGLVYDGSNNAPSISMSALGTKWTANFWVKWASDLQWPIMYGGGQFLGIRAGGTPFCAVELTSVTVPVGKWAMVTMVGDGTNTTPYINGVAGTAVADGANYGAPTTLGAAPAGSCLAEPLIYNRALSASEVVALYEAGAPNPADIGYVSGISPAAWAPGFSSPTVTSSSGSSVTATGQYGASFSTLLGTVGAVPVTVVIDVTASNITSAKAYFANSAADSSGVAVSSVITLNEGRNVINLKRSSSATTYLCVEIAGGVTTWTFTGTNITVGRGLLLAPDAAQAGGGLTWYDTSGNAANITLPASGVSWNVPSSQKTASGWTYGGNLTVSSSSAYLKLASTGSSNTWDLFSDSNGSFYLSQSGVVNALRVFPTTGNVSIGAASTDNGNGKLQLATHTTSAGGIGFGTVASLHADGNNGYLALTPPSGTTAGYRLYNSTTLRGQLAYSGTDLYLDASTGSLFLRTGSSTTALTLDSSQNATFAGQVNSGTSSSSGYNNNRNVQLEAASGRVIVNHENGVASGSIYAGFGYNGSGIGSITQDGTSGVLYNTTSDERLKENVRDVTNSGVLIDALKPRVFDWKNNGDKDRFGFLAQEVYAVFPQAVKKGDDGKEVTDAWAMDAAKLIPVLVAEIKALRVRIAAVETR